MNEAWRIILPGWRDLLDIAIVGVLFYQVWRLMRGTRAVPMFLGLLLILITYVVVQLMELDLISLVFKEFATVWAIAIVILFQPELRRFLIHFGNRPALPALPHAHGGLAEEIAKAARTEPPAVRRLRHHADGPARRRRPAYAQGRGDASRRCRSLSAHAVARWRCHHPGSLIQAAMHPAARPARP